MHRIPFNKPYLSPNTHEYLDQVIKNAKASGNGEFTKACHDFFEERFGFSKCLLTTSCSDALEMIALLLEIEPGDEVIMPSFTFVSTANAFVLRGANIKFADCQQNHPNISVSEIERLITPRTKAIVIVHYGGVACEMDEIMALSEQHQLYVVEDAAHAIDAYYKDKPLGSIGHFASFSFHETKNIQCGEGGMLVINDARFFDRAEIIWEKGTNRSAFFRGEVDKYNWVDIGSSYLPSELIAAFLYAQIENLENIQEKRVQIWKRYHERLSPIANHFRLLDTPNFATDNGHLFALICKSEEERKHLIDHLAGKDINAVFHYQSLHKSPYYQSKYLGGDLPNSDRYSNCLVRLPIYYELGKSDQERVIEAIGDFYKNVGT